jgi:pyridoxine 5-phosphate synthase
MFIDPDAEQIRASQDIGADIVELHTGSYAAQKKELARIREAAEICDELDIECHAGHGLTFYNVGPVASIANIVELNIGHFLIGEAIFVGLKNAIQEMRARIDGARGV